MVNPYARIAVVTLLAASMGWAQVPASSSKAGASTSAQSAATQSAATPGTTAGSPDPALSDLLAQLQAEAAKSDGDLGRLRIDKWKADGPTKKQAEESAASIHRNLSSAVPELLQQVRSQPESLTTNFRLYRDLNALYETFLALAESAGAFGPTEQYSPLAADLGQLDHLRHRVAERLDGLAGSSDAELLQLRTRIAGMTKAPATTPPVSSKIVVDDTKPAAKKKAKHPAPPKTQP